MSQLGNVIQFMNYQAPYAGNFIKSIVRLDEHLARSGTTLVYLLPGGAAEQPWAQALVKAGKPVFFLTGSARQDMALITRLVRQFAIRIVHTHFTTARHHAYINVARRWSRHRLTIVRHLHNHYRRSSFLVEGIKRLVADVDYYIGCGPSVAEHHRETYHLRPSQITAVPNAVDFARLDTFVRLDRSAIAAPEMTRLVLLFGFDYYRKGVDLALEAIDALNQDGHAIGLLLSLSTNQASVLAKITDRYGRVPAWLRIVDARDDIATYYQSCDAFLSASRAEGLCYSLIEAAYCQTPIIASDIPGHMSLNLPYTNEFVPQDVTSLKQQLLRVLFGGGDEQQTQLRAQQAFVRKEYDLDEWAGRILRIYRSLQTERTDVISYLTPAAG